MSSYSDYSNAVANLLASQGQVAARAAEQRGALWGNAISNIGQTIAQIPQTQALQEERQQRAQLIQLQVQKSRREQAQVDALNSAMSSALTPEGLDLEKFGQAVANTPAAGEYPRIAEGVQKYLETTAKVRQVKLENDAKEADQLEALASMADAADTPEGKASLLKNGLVTGIKSQTILPQHALPLLQQFVGQDGTLDAGKAQNVIRQMQQLSAPNAEKRAQAAAAQANTAVRVAELPKVQAEGEVAQQVAAGTQGGLTPDQQAVNRLRETEIARSQAAQAEQARHNRAEEGLARQREQREGAGLTEIKPDSREYRIAQDLAYGKLTFADFNRIYGRAMGNAALKAGIYDTARQLNPGFNPAEFELGFKLAGNSQIRQRLVAIDSLGPVIDRAEKLADQVGNSDIPAFNKLLLGAKFQVGNTTVTNYRQLQTLLGDEVGNALGVGTGSDLKTRLGLDLVNPNLGPVQFKQTMEQLRNVLAARKQSLLGTMGPYGGAANPQGVPPPTGTRRYYDSSGNPVSR